MSDLCHGVWKPRPRIVKTVSIARALVDGGLAPDTRVACRLIRLGAVKVDGKTWDQVETNIGAGVVVSTSKGSYSVRIKKGEDHAPS